MIRLPPISPLFPYPTLFRSPPPALVLASSRGGPRDPDRFVGRRGPRRPRARGDGGATDGQRLQVGRPPRQRLLWGLPRSEEHTSELQSQSNLGFRLLLEKKK